MSDERIQSTLMYIQIAKTSFGHRQNDEFICKIARTPKELSSLIETGFEYVMEKGGLTFFRKRK